MKINWFDKFCIELRELSPNNESINNAIEFFSIPKKDVCIGENIINSIYLNKKEEFEIFNYYSASYKSLTSIEQTLDFIKQQFYKRLKVIKNSQERQLQTSLGPYLRGLRKSRGFTLREVYERSGISQSYVLRVEKNERKPSLPILQRLSKVYNVPLQELLEVAGITIYKNNSIDLTDLFQKNDISIENDLLSDLEKDLLLKALKISKLYKK